MNSVHHLSQPHKSWEVGTIMLLILHRRTQSYRRWRNLQLIRQLISSSPGSEPGLLIPESFVPVLCYCLFQSWWDRDSKDPIYHSSLPHLLVPEPSSHKWLLFSHITKATQSFPSAQPPKDLWTSFSPRILEILSPLPLGLFLMLLTSVPQPLAMKTKPTPCFNNDS